MIITRRLHGDHRSFLKLSDRMEKDLNAGTNEKRRDYEQTFTLLYPLLGVHEKAEEELFFPFLAGSSQDFASAVKVLQSEHKQLRAKGAAILRLLQKDLDETPVLQKLNTEYCNGLRAHIYNEDNILFPAVERLMDPIRLDQLSQELTGFVHSMGPIQRSFIARRRW